MFTYEYKFSAIIMYSELTYFLNCIFSRLFVVISTLSLNQDTAGSGLPLHRHTSLRLCLNFTETFLSPDTSMGCTENIQTERGT
jgi:hypothetical protein